jgi:Short C-terminal domain
VADAPTPITPSPRPPGRGRRTLARALVVVGVLLAVVSGLANFVRYEALDNGQFRETSRLLISNEEIQAQVAATLVDALYTNIDVAAELGDQLPDNLQPLAGPIAGISRELADRAARELLARPAAQTLWVESTALAQERLRRVLEGDTTLLSTTGGDVTLDLQPLVTRLSDRFSFVSNASERLPADAGRIVILKSNQLKTAQDATQLLKVIASWIWVLALAAFAGAIWLARGRRRIELRAIAIGLVVAGFLLLAVRSLAGRYVVDSLVASDSVKAAASEAWDIATRLLAGSGWSLVIVGIVTLAGVWLAGPGPRASGAREALAPWLRRPALAFGTAGLLYVLVLWWQPTAQFGRWLYVLVFAVLAAVGIEVLRRQTAREHPDAVAGDWLGEARGRFGSRREGRGTTSGAPEPGAAAELERLAALHGSGALTDEEFTAAKATLLTPAPPA